MDKSAKQPSNVKKGPAGGKHVQRGAQPDTVRPAQEIADDEVEIGKTGRQARNEEHAHERTQALGVISSGLRRRRRRLRGSRSG